MRTLLEKRAAVEAATGGRGVLSVHDAIEVMPRVRNDEALLADVRRALARLAFPKDTTIRAVVDDGVVTLRGDARSRMQSECVAHVVAGVSGVSDVRDQTLVRDASPSNWHGGPSSREALTERIRDALSSDPRVVPDDISLYGESGHITLSGTVPTLLAAEAALADAAGTPGVQSARSLIAVRPKPVTDRILADRLSEAFGNDDLSSVGKVRVEVEHGRVKLTGAVSGELEHARAREIASSFDGVRDLDDRITVAGGIRPSPALFAN
jgi:osmotically-inducible protein OsmY